MRVNQRNVDSSRLPVVPASKSVMSFARSLPQLPLFHSCFLPFFICTRLVAVREKGLQTFNLVPAPQLEVAQGSFPLHSMKRTDQVGTSGCAWELGEWSSCSTSILAQPTSLILCPWSTKPTSLLSLNITEHTHLICRAFWTVVCIIDR